MSDLAAAAAGTSAAAAAAASAASAMDKYENLGKIGGGSFGSVNKIRRREDGKILVWKEMDYGKMTDKEKQMLVREVNILREFRHPNIVRYYDRIIDRNRYKIYIIMEYCPGGDLAQLIKRCKRERTYLPEETIWKYFYDVLAALEQCHNRPPGKKVLHRDIKPANLFLDTSDSVKLGDFGLARVLGDKSLFAHTNVGTPFYMSPEQIRDEAYNEKSDIWSMGCVIYELAALTVPFEATNHMTLAIKIKEGKFPRLPSRYSEDLQRAVASMLRTEQALRPTLDDLLRLPQIQMRAREKKMQLQYSSIKQREEEVARREASLASLEQDLIRREQLIAEREVALGMRDAVPPPRAPLVQRTTSTNSFAVPPPISSLAPLPRVPSSAGLAAPSACTNPTYADNAENHGNAQFAHVHAPGNGFANAFAQ